ncbi:hypothetical protein N7452_002404 [Penicillium brevicompactum]|uniref:Uncharacterized protein n=1 Tax=Penicillium brevicompactum TaxID=5074 RepID=A0A9W9R5T0_PENBR|nr:hypothetical protein N7452_002404 [Penicillium brevicompactum]
MIAWILIDTFYTFSILAHDSDFDELDKTDEYRHGEGINEEPEARDEDQELQLVSPNGSMADSGKV